MSATFQNPVLSSDNSASYRVSAPQWEPNAFRCHLALVREDDGSYSAIALNLPGAGSCGDNEEQAILNAREAIAGILDSYVSEGQAIPWVNRAPEQIPADARLKWILVNI